MNILILNKSGHLLVTVIEVGGGGGGGGGGTAGLLRARLGPGEGRSRGPPWPCRLKLSEINAYLCYYALF